LETIVETRWCRDAAALATRDQWIVSRSKCYWRISSVARVRRRTAAVAAGPSTRAGIGSVAWVIVGDTGCRGVVGVMPLHGGGRHRGVASGFGRRARISSSPWAGSRRGPRTGAGDDEDDCDDAVVCMSERRVWAGDWAATWAQTVGEVACGRRLVADYGQHRAVADPWPGTPAIGGWSGRGERTLPMLATPSAPPSGGWCN